MRAAEVTGGLTATLRARCVEGRFAPVPRRGDEVVISAMEHHANIVPWTMLRERLGIVLKIVRPGRYDRLATGLYLSMGWSGMMLYDSVVRALPTLALGFVVAGGIFYTLGVAFHAWQRLRFQNAIWHGFVLGGAACHYTAVLDIVLG